MFRGVWFRVEGDSLRVGVQPVSAQEVYTLSA